MTYKPTPIEKVFLDRSFCKMGAPLLRIEDAIDMVRICKERGIGILGVDGFHTFPDGKYQPDQNHECDFSDNMEGSHEKAIEFMEKRRQLNLYYEVVTDETR